MWYQLKTQYENSTSQIGEIVKLSIHGTYCPDKSLISYSSDEIENNPNWVKVYPCIECNGFGVKSLYGHIIKCNSCNGTKLE